MNDLEICKRIAEIEGEVVAGVGDHNVFIKCQPSLVGNVQYNPLTDDALCWKLMVEHEMTVGFTDCPAGSGRAYFATGNHKVTRNNVCSEYCDTPNKALCQAIIAAHKESNND